MKEFIVDVLMIYGGYELVSGYWKKNKKKIIRNTILCIKEELKEAMEDPDNPVAIQFSIGGKDK